MSDFGHTLQQSSGSTQLVWLAHSYPPGGEVYDFLARPDTLAEIRKVGPKLFLGLDSGYGWAARDFAKGQIGADQLEQKIEDFQKQTSAQIGWQGPGHVDPVPPASLAKLIINAKAAGVELDFINGSRMYEFDESHMRQWIDSAKDQRSYGSGLVGALIDKALGPQGVEGNVVANALQNPSSYLGRAIVDKVGWVNKAHLDAAEEVLSGAAGQRAVVVFPSESVEAVHNFDLSLAMAATKAEAENRGERVALVNSEDLSKFAERIRKNPPAGLVQRLDLEPSVLSEPSSGIEQRLARETPQSGVTPAFSLADNRVSEQVEIPDWKLLASNEPAAGTTKPTGLIKAAYRPE